MSSKKNLLFTRFILQCKLLICKSSEKQTWLVYFHPIELVEYSLNTLSVISSGDSYIVNSTKLFLTLSSEFSVFSIYI